MKTIVKVEEQQDLSQLIDQVPTGIGIYEVRGDVITQIYMNTSFYEMLGTTRAERAEYFGENAMAAAHPDDVPKIHQVIKELFAGNDKCTVSYRLKLPEDKWFWLNLTASVVKREGNFIRIYGAFSDYNEIKQAEMELEASRKTLEIALKSAKVMTWRYNYKTKEITDSSTLGKHYGLPKVVPNVPQAILDRGFISDESTEEYLNMFKEIAEEKVTSVDSKSNVMGENGYIWYKQIYTPTYDAQGNYVDSIGVAIDITEQKEHEQRYMEQLNLSKIAAQEALATATFNLSKNHVEEYDSKEQLFKEILGVGTVDEVLTEIKSHVYDVKESKAFSILSNCKDLISGFKKGKEHFEMRHRLGTDNRWFQTTMDIISNPYTGDVESIAFLRDITDIVQAELVVKQLMNVDYKSILIIDTKTGEAVPFSHNNWDEDLEEIMELKESKGNSADGLATFLREYAVPGTAEKAIQENSIEYIREQLKTEPFYENVYTLIQEGKKRQYRTLYTYLGNDENVLLSAVQDTTKIYEQEEKQKYELSLALKQANDANQAKTEFMSRMSHDMRTPMNAIIGLSALTIDDAKNPKAVRENMGKMRQASNFMLGLVNDILDMAKIEDGLVTLNMEPYAYSDFLTNMKTMFLPQCEAKNIKINFVEPVHIDPTGLTDKIRINQIFFNIFSNAVKYTPVGGTIDCKVQNFKQEGNRISGEYVIKDTGIGMSEQFQRRLFEPFMQEDTSVTPELQGSGLGLSITKQLVELMGGYIKVESEKGVGTTVIVGLSFELAEKNTSKPMSLGNIETEESLLEGKRVLLVEDHPLNAQIARRLLEKKHMIVTHAENGKLGVEKFNASPEGTFDVILMDVRMPEVSGFEATEQIRDLNRHDAKSVPIIAMSANAYPEDIKEGMDSGMNDYLVKPVDPEKLYEMLLKNL